MRRKQLMETHPNYYYGQLLHEGDFLAEQDYHVRAPAIPALRKSIDVSTP